jgi:histidinol-phosphate aminotransferase
MKPVDITKMMRKDVLKMRPYTPIVPPEVLAERAGLTMDEVIKLDGNENPYGCSPRVGKALARYPYFSIYPDPEQREVRAALSKYVGMGVEYILAGAGSDELIDLILRLFLEPGDGVVNCPPTFGMYPFCTDVCGGRTVELSLRWQRHSIIKPRLSLSPRPTTRQPTSPLRPISSR